MLIFVNGFFVLFLQWNVKRLCFEYDTDPYYQALDDKVKVKLLSVSLKVWILLTMRLIEVLANSSHFFFFLSL